MSIHYDASGRPITLSITGLGNTAGASTWTGANNLVLSAGSGITVSISGNTIGLVGNNRSNAWEMLGVYVASASPSSPVVYSDWRSGSSGYWAWVSVPP